MNRQCRSERPEDIAAIRHLTASAFADVRNSAHTEHLIVDALRLAGALDISLVVGDPDELVGHAALSAVAISDASPGWFGLGPVCVSAGARGQGIGSVLIRRALQLLRMRGAAGCVVLGNPGYYGRFGFRHEPGLTLPGVPQQFFQALSFTDRMPRGTVTYHPAFSASGRPDDIQTARQTE